MSRRKNYPLLKVESQEGYIMWFPDRSVSEDWDILEKCNIAPSGFFLSDGGQRVKEVRHLLEHGSDAITVLPGVEYTYTCSRGSLQDIAASMIAVMEDPSYISDSIRRLLRDVEI